MLNPDEIKLEEITADFTKSLIKNKIDDLRIYEELKARINELIGAELFWRKNYKDNQDLAQFWHGENN